MWSLYNNKIIKYDLVAKLWDIIIMQSLYQGAICHKVIFERWPCTKQIFIPTVVCKDLTFWFPFPNFPT